jgi:hypothetical protein
LMECCCTFGLAVANTFIAKSPEELVTFRSPGTPPLQEICERKFATLDYLLVPQAMLEKVVDLYSCRSEALASQHFLLEARLSIGFDGTGLPHFAKKKQVDRTLLKKVDVAMSFNQVFQRSLAATPLQRDSADVNEIAEAVCGAFGDAAAVLETTAVKDRLRPWISQRTLDIVGQRRQSRRVSDWPEEKRLSKLAKKSARQDRREWLTDIAGANSWEQVRKLRRKTCHKQGRLKDLNGQYVDSDERAQTLATYLQEVQWAVRPATLIDAPPLFAELPVERGPISLKELRLAIVALRDKKASGPDGCPVEFWKAVVDSPGPNLSEGAAWLLELCNKVWLGSSVPEDWHLQHVALIYKKGDPAECGNYRPICLLNAAYKIFAMILLKRLLRAGADGRVSATQFGFRRNRGTEDALHCARRAIDRAVADRGGSLHLLALDWQKAFDSINPDAMMNALRRLGLPPHFCEVMRSIYTGRLFEVRECSQASERKRQDSGICQGCPLSPFLFVLVMTVLMHDARELLSAPSRDALRKGQLADILYADDTLIFGSSASGVEEYAQAVEKAGASYGMSLHWGKTQAMCVGNAVSLRKPDGSLFENRESLQYLGALLTASGRVDSEISRKLGLARADFNQLQRLWGHVSVSQKDKVQYFKSFILSKLRYGFSTMWLVTSQRRRLDGFVARCLRRIVRIPAAFISRVSNAAVYEKVGMKPFTLQLLKHQMQLLRKVAVQSADHPLRVDTFEGATLNPQIGRYIRRVGRPRQDWTTQLLREGRARVGAQRFDVLISDRSDGADTRWKAEVEKCFK